MLIFPEAALVSQGYLIGQLPTERGMTALMSLIGESRPLGSAGSKLSQSFISYLLNVDEFIRIVRTALTHPQDA